MRRIIKVKTIVGLVIALIIGLFTMLDIVNIKENPTDYINVYQISEQAPHWMFKSISSYITSNVLKVIISFAYITLSIIVLIKKPKKLINGLLIFELVIFIWILRYYYLYYASGFDHYPGFDPYIF